MRVSVRSKRRILSNSPSSSSSTLPLPSVFLTIGCLISLDFFPILSFFPCSSFPHFHPLVAAKFLIQLQTMPSVNEIFPELISTYFCDVCPLPRIGCLFPGLLQFRNHRYLTWAFLSPRRTPRWCSTQQQKNPKKKQKQKQKSNMKVNCKMVPN